MAVQLAVARGAKVIATASPARHDQLRGYGAEPVAYGEGLADRVRAIGPVDAALDLVGTDEALDTSVELVADRGRIATIAGFARAGELGIAVLTGADGGQAIRDAARPELIKLAAEGKLEVTVDKVLSARRRRPRRTGICRPVTPEGKSYWFPSFAIAMTDDKMLARIAALLRQAENTDNAHEAEAFMAAAQRLATTTSIDLAVARAHAATRTPAQAPVQRTITIGEAGTKGLRTYVQLFVVIAARQRREVRRRVQLDVRLRLRVRRGHRRHPCAVRQPGGADGEGLRRLHRHGPAPAHPHHHRAAELPVGVRRAGGPAAERRARGGQGRRPPATATNARARLSRCATRTSSSSRSTARRPRRGARGGPTARRRAIRRRPGGQATAQGSGPGWGRAPNSPVPAAPWTGDGTPCRVTPNAQRSTPQSNSCGRCSTARTSTAPAPSSSSAPTSPCRPRRGSPRSIPCSATSTTCSATPSVRSGGPPPSR